MLPERIRMMIVQRPAAVGHDVLAMPARHHIVLREDVRPHEARRLALAGERADPVKVILPAAAIRVVLHVIPHAVGDSLELELDGVGIAHRVEVAAELIHQKLLFSGYRRL